MVDLRQVLHSFLDSKTDFEIINAMKQYNEPSQYVSYYFLSEPTETMSNGVREYNATDDKIDITYAPMTIVPIQIDIRGSGAFSESRALFYGFQTWQSELKALGIGFMGVSEITPIPNVQNGYVKEGYQFNIFLSYDTSIVVQIEKGESIQWQQIDKQ